MSYEKSILERVRAAEAAADRSVFEVEDEELPPLPEGVAAHLLGANDRRHVQRARWLAGQVLAKVDPADRDLVARALRELVDVSHWSGESFSGARASEIKRAIDAEVEL